MSERILRALMQLFAIIAKVEDNEEGEASNPSEAGGRKIVGLFLKQDLTQDLVEEYLKLFDEFLEAHQGKSKKKDGKRKRTSVNSVKVLRICTQINEELAQRQKVIVLIRLLEFISSNMQVTEQEWEFVSTVADTFNIPEEEYLLCKRFVESSIDEIDDSPSLLVVDNKEALELQETKHIHSAGIVGQVRILRLTSVNSYFLRYYGTAELYLNGQVIYKDRFYILNQGSSIRSPKVQPVYYSDIISRFLSDTTAAKIVFKANNIQYHFKGGKIGLHDITIEEESGKLLGIMGGSGAGKSTLLNVLNGNYTPSIGEVRVNGVDIHGKSNNDDLEGLIGFVPQDDLLIDELTVFQNLFYNAKLCFGNLPDSKIAKLVLNLLNSIGLYETKDLRVGSPMDKTISGGQRKRLNIALELIREPSVLFVDEPTSGLSSRDSENIMDLLKELALKGKVIFVVIHQPSSDIFKMFDKLMILDQGGYPIYYGNPVDSVIYFKRLVNHVNAEESECHTCGNVNPEQVFNIIESKVVDEYGNLTQNRKISPKEWNHFYKEKIEGNQLDVEDAEEIPESIFKIPNKFKQFKVYFVRDVLSKFTNKQYMLINMLEAPALAAILAFFMKFYNSEGKDYIFRESENIPQYLFISVVVALFIGLTVSAEEIIKDQKILKREKFLNLSRSSYLFSKISIMFIISAIQTVFFVFVGNLILEIDGMFLDYWLILFSTSCFANMLGLNISASFNSAKVIYILIPILIIPQLLFSGVIVKFDKLNPVFSGQETVPWIGNVMASRWAYEALAVTQFKENEYEKHYYKFEKQMRFANWKKDYWVKELKNMSDYVKKNRDDKTKSSKVKKELVTMKNELEKELRFITGLPPKEEKRIKGLVSKLTYSAVNNDVIDDTKKFLEKLAKHYRKVFNDAEKAREKQIKTMTKKLGDKGLADLKDAYKNEALESFVTNKNSIEHLLKQDGQLIMKTNPIYLDPYDSYFLSSHFYAPQKMLFGTPVNTKWANIMVIWFMSIFLAITLYFDALRRFIEGIGKIGERIIPPKAR
jgi:ABC-type multidrug transport system ATPase subunit